ncbi:hypothetical protein TW65_00048 [Stemphylium lycopersici]|nr:hypothetical protein TW65_00048 [Stemphylium lycopersici]
MSDAIIDPAEVAVYFFLEAYHACLSKDSFDDINAGFQDPIAITLTPSALLASWHFPRSESIELGKVRGYPWILTLGYEKGCLYAGSIEDDKSSFLFTEYSSLSMDLGEHSHLNQSPDSHQPPSANEPTGITKP